MKRIALLAGLLAPVAAAAQDPKPPAAAETPPERTDSRLPLDAMRHHQPTAADVQQRERQLEGKRAARRQQAAEQREFDELYRDVMRRSAPGRGPDTGASPPPAPETPAH